MMHLSMYSTVIYLSAYLSVCLYSRDINAFVDLFFWIDDVGIFIENQKTLFLFLKLMIITIIIEIMIIENIEKW